MCSFPIGGFSFWLSDYAGGGDISSGGEMGPSFGGSSDGEISRPEPMETGFPENDYGPDVFEHYRTGGMDMDYDPPGDPGDFERPATPEPPRATLSPNMVREESASPIYIGVKSHDSEPEEKEIVNCILI